ncbi:hypothetical protein CUJ83_06535 [Methanocella sp. CWC-04]|uniref:Uncharacterized protein n=2 Tax=Methanooceanicella nereidis TaxID=2052831 RepID=A0AAP2REM6_9EURY|nr:hypothetical protein [Methanocella sp. CWC-04]
MNYRFIYNDELLEFLSTQILLGARPGAAYQAALPEIKKMLFDFDIYMVSFLSDEDVGKLEKEIKGKDFDGKTITDKKLNTKLMAIRDNARTFVNIASKYNSVCAYVNNVLCSGDRAQDMEPLMSAFTDDESEYRLKQVGSATCKKFLSLF